MFSQLNKLNMVDAAELKAYINRIVDDMDKAQLAAMEKAPLGYAAKIRDKIETLLEAHYRETFDKWLETERIVCNQTTHGVVNFRLKLADIEGRSFNRQLLVIDITA